ncbi:MAG TPA: GAF domain-containing protein [Roseiflexaceae bacterium]|nr:GAF domain-containing protein [Roseiflexaceae bacterium]
MRITTAIETAATLDELFLLALHELNRMFSVDHSLIILLSEEIVGTIAGEYPPRVAVVPNLPLDQSPIAQRVILDRHAVALTVEHPGADADAINLLLGECGIVSSQILPLIAQDEVIGLLLLGYAAHGSLFAEEDGLLLRVLGGQLASAIAAFRLHDAARRRNQELTTLNEIAATITSVLDTREVYRLVVQKLSTYFNVEAGSLLLIDDDSGDLQFVMTIEGGEEKLAGVRVPVGRGIVGSVVSSREWAIVHDVATDPRFYAKVSEDSGFRTRSILCVPMIAKGRVIGAIELLNKRDGPFTEDEALRLLRMGAFIGVAIENARLFQQVTDGRDRLVAILNSTTDGILMGDMDGIVRIANPTAAQICACDERELLGRQLDDVIDVLGSRAQERETRTWGSDEAGIPAMVVELTFGGSEHRFVRILRFPVHGAEGIIYGQLVVLRNITHERELEQLREDYTNMLIHDLRAPLTSIMNGILMVQRGLGGPVTEQQNELLRIAYQGSQAMLELVNNLLDISKMEQGRMTLDMRPISPYILIDMAVDRLRVSAESAAITIEQQTAIDLPTTDADDDKILRVMQNLLDNAIKFSPRESVVRIGAHYLRTGQPLPGDIPLRQLPAIGNHLVFWVQDRGAGIPAVYFDRIFEKFGQVNGKKVRGTGLGLTFCKLATEAHGGQIWVESTEGHGSIFAFTLPIVTT